MDAFNEGKWTHFYEQSDEILVPGGYIEQFKWSVMYVLRCQFCTLQLMDYSSLDCDDGSLCLRLSFCQKGPMFVKAAAKMGKNIDTMHHFKNRMEANGFLNVNEKTYKLPLGEWTKGPVLREAGEFTSNIWPMGWRTILCKKLYLP